jgi:hypothetical protein
MALRKEGLLKTRREGKYIFYRLADLETIDLIRKVGELAGLAVDQLPISGSPEAVSNCPCPKCVRNSAIQVSHGKGMDLSTT